MRRGRVFGARRASARLPGISLIQQPAAALAAFVLLVLWPPDVHAQYDYAGYLWDHPEYAKPKGEDVAFTPEKFSHAKNESIFVMGYFNDGWVFMLSLFHIDSKVLDRWGIYVLVADPTGKRYWKTVAPRERDISMSRDHFSYFDGVNFMEDSGDQFHLSCAIEDLTCDLTFEKEIPAWTPGTGHVDYEPDGDTFQYKAVFVPLSHLTGTIQVDDVELEVSGRGYAEKTLFVNPLGRQQPYLHALRVYTPGDEWTDESVHIGIHQVILNKKYGERELKRLVVAEGDHWLFTTRDYDFDPTGYRALESTPYEYPTGFHLHAAKNGYVLDGTVRQKVFFDNTDVFANLPQWVQKILVVFFKRPVYYRYVAEFDGTLTDPEGEVRELEMSGPYEYVVVF